MAHNLFRDVVEPSRKIGNKNRYTVSLSILVHILIIAVAIVMPAAAPSVLLAPATRLPFVAAGSLPAPPPEPPPRRAARADAPPASLNTEAAPLEASPDIIPARSLASTDELPGAVEDTLGAAAGPGIPGGLGPSPLPLPQRVDPPAPIRIGPTIKRPTKVKDVKPIYPVLAQAAKVEGLVIIEAIIGLTGKVQDLKVLRSHPMLEAAALDAVRQWEFTPTLLNGSPVAVIMTVTVDFRLR